MRRSRFVCCAQQRQPQTSSTWRSDTAATMLHTGHGMAAADPSKHGFFTDVKEMAKVLAGECQSHTSCCVHILLCLFMTDR